MTVLCTDNYWQPISGAQAHITVHQIGDKYRVDTWLPAGLTNSTDYPEWTDRADTIEAARSAFAQRRANLLNRLGFVRTMGSL